MKKNLSLLIVSMCYFLAGDRGYPDRVWAAPGMAEQGGEGARGQRHHAPLQPQARALPARRLLLEETQGRQDHARRPHEAQGAGSRGKARITIKYGI